MQKKRKFYYSLILGILISSFPEKVFSQSIDEYSSLSLEEILNMEVTTASKKSEKISDASGTITAYSNTQIENMGYYTLSDLANVTPGYSSYTKYGEKVFETRGQKADSFNNNKHLLLVDGIPIHNARNYKVPIEEEMPLFFAERVEFLKGPASALYGTGAFYGVVNVIPKSLKENGTKIETKLSSGTFDFNKRAMANALYKSDNNETRLSLSYYKKDASRAFVGTKNDNNNLYWDDQNSVFLNLSNKISSGIFEGFTTGLTYLSKNDGLGEHWMENAFTHQTNDLTWESIVPYVKYQKSLNDSWKINSYVKYNESMEKGWWSGFSNDTFSKYDGKGNLFYAYDMRISNLEGLAETYYDFNDRMSLIAGLNMDSRYQKGNPSSYSYIFSSDEGIPFQQEKSSMNDSNLFNTYSGYTQFTWRAPILSDLNITLGSRYDMGQSIGKKYQQTYQQLSPRISLVQKFNENFNLKLMWGNALRAPGLKETGLNSESKVLYGSEIKDLKAETIGTFEGGVTFNNDNISSQITGFYNRTVNALDGSKYKDANIFINSSGDTIASGLEFDTQYILNNTLSLFTNYAFANAKDPNGKFLNDIPIHKLNFGINHTLKVPFTLNSNVVGRWVSGYSVSDSKITQPSGSFVLDLNFRAPIDNNLSLELQVRNLLDSSYKLPKNGLVDIPMAGRNFLFTLGYSM